MCHLVFLLPIAGLGLFAFLPAGQAIPLYVGILALSSLLYAFVWEASILPVRTGVESMKGRPAVVVDELDRQGLVRARGELWRARSREPVAVGEVVTVISIEGLTASVERRDEQSVS